MLNNFKATAFSCYLGYITQAIMINLPPLLFVSMQNDFNVPLGKLTLIITIVFVMQLVIDLIATKFVDKIGYKLTAVLSQGFAFVGLLLLGVLPFIMKNAYLGILISIMIGSIGTGLTEVVISPIIEAIPGDKNKSLMNFLHSFYCWGSVLVVLVATAFFPIFGSNNWRYLPIALAAVPLIDGILFSMVPINHLVEDEKERMNLLDLLKNSGFIIIFIMMFTAGAAELAVSQWASYFAEKGLGVTKTLGNLIGPCLFAVLMGSSRVICGIFADKIDQKKILYISAVGCVLSYLIIILVPHPIVSLIGCAMVGLFVGSLWPGCLNFASKRLPKGGTAMFAIAALGGDLGCTLGPTIVGIVSNATTGGADGLKTGLSFAIVFPIIMICCLLVLRLIDKKRQKNNNML